MNVKNTMKKVVRRYKTWCITHNSIPVNRYVLVLRQGGEEREGERKSERERWNIPWKWLALFFVDQKSQSLNTYAFRQNFQEIFLLHICVTRNSEYILLCGKQKHKLFQAIECTATIVICVQECCKINISPSVIFLKKRKLNVNAMHKW